MDVHHIEHLIRRAHNLLDEASKRRDVVLQDAKAIGIEERVIKYLDRVDQDQHSKQVT